MCHPTIYHPKNRVGRNRTIDDSEILEVARRVFREHGHAATTRDVARAAGISQSVLYQRFKTKDDLFFAAMSPSPPDMAVLLGDEGDAMPDVERHLGDIALRVLAYFDAVTPAILHLVTHPAFDPKVIAQAHDRILAAGLAKGVAERLDALRQKGLVGSVDPRAAAEAFIAALHSFAMFHILSGTSAKPTDEERVRGFVRILWSGLGPNPANRD